MSEFISIDHELLAEAKRALNVALAAAAKAVSGSHSQATLTFKLDMFEEDQVENWNGTNSLLGDVKVRINLVTKEKVFDEGFDFGGLAVINTINGPILKDFSSQTTFDDIYVQVEEVEQEDTSDD